MKASGYAISLLCFIAAGGLTIGGWLYAGWPSDGIDQAACVICHVGGLSLIGMGVFMWREAGRA